jgi:outer membrane protein OmpA-like peptidoglycan-associated protein
MRPTLLTIAVFGGACALCAQSQKPAAEQKEPVPIYRVTVIERTAKAVNYFYRSGPTKIDFRGTVLLPESKGNATVESRQGRTEIDASFEHLKASQRFGREYLTYVLWAITPEGRPNNIGEIVPDHADNGHLHVTTDLQAFALIVTAEPYSAVRQPSDVVVLENELRPDTAGSTETVNAKYELLPRGQYTWNVTGQLTEELANAPKVSQREYEALSELYQAENAVGVAGAARAQELAPNTFQKSQQLLTEARQMQLAKKDSSRVVEIARQAAQTAEDARMIAVARAQEQTLKTARDETSQAREQQAAAERALAKAEAEARQARADADAAQQRAQAAQQQVESERAARSRAEALAAQSAVEASQARESAAAVTAAAARIPRPDPNAEASQQRIRLLEDLNAVLATRDTPRGLVVTIADSGFTGELLRPPSSELVARLAAIVARRPGLKIAVEGHSSSAGEDGIARRRAEEVRATMTSNGLAPSEVTSQGFGNSRPLTSNATPQGRAENSRVEIVISGPPIGSVPFWDRTYSLAR